MRCERCNAEIKEGHVFCDRCGAEIRIVPDFNMLEEEVLPFIVSQTGEYDNKTLNGRSKGTGFLKSKKAAAVILILVFAAVCIGGVMYTQSYTFEYGKAVKAAGQERYSEAIGFYENAISRKQTVAAYIGMGDACLGLSDYERANKCYMDALSVAGEGKDPKEAADCYSALFLLYIESEDAASCEELYHSISNEGIKELIDAAFVAPPDFTLASGNYYDDIKVEIKAGEDSRIYYTMDGSMPTELNGILFEKKLKLKKGEHTVMACAADDSGRTPLPSVRAYNITYVPPQMPVASPSSGTFYAPAYVTLSSPDGGEIYYTFSGRVPTEASTHYTGPIRIPEGNNVLSAIVADKHGLRSEILRCNYIYLP